MKLKLWLLLLPLLGMSVAVSAQSSLPRKVSDVTLLDLNGDPTQLPYWGEKNLMIFYIDPDHHKQNEDFTTDMEENHRVEGENLFGFGVMNLKDAPMIPNGMARNMARKRTASNGATVLADQNNTFVLLLVSKEGDLVFMRKGPLSDADKKEFYQVVQKYR